MKFTASEEEKIGRHLNSGQCPNCGSDEKKYIYPQKVDRITLREHRPHDEDMDMEINSYEAILTQCPICGMLMLFSKHFILNGRDAS